MCGIIGYTGSNRATDILLSGLHALEYRGYDSAGIAVAKDHTISLIRSSGRVRDLEEKVKCGYESDGTCGIGHTRWATHGMPTERNAHPHAAKHLLLVHNGIIDNYLEIKTRLIKSGIVFESETDTECIAHLISSYYEVHHDPLRAIREATSELAGSFALGILFRDFPNRLYATRKDSPLICAVNTDGSYLASDVPAILPYSKSIYRLGEREIAELTGQKITFYSPDGEKIEKASSIIEWTFDAARKDGYSFFMEKEIREESEAVRRVVTRRLAENGLPSFSQDAIPADFFADIDAISIIGCGSAMHAGLVGRGILEAICKIPVTVDLASEYRYKPPVTRGKTLAVLISQSGETADTLAAMRLAKANGLSTLGIINVVGSAIAREADHVLYTGAGPEIAVATTKGYTTQVAMLVILALGIAAARKTAETKEIRALLRAIAEDVPRGIAAVIENDERIRQLAGKIESAEHLFYIGRGTDHHAAIECSLKLKEISYIHSEAYAAGELKHGTLSLVTDGTPVIALATDPAYYDKMAGNMKEVRARGGYVILVCPDEFAGASEYADEVFRIPAVSPYLAPFFTVVFAQLLAFHAAIGRGCDVDHPRNLAKSVTVE